MLWCFKEQQFVIVGVLVEDSNNYYLMFEVSEWVIIEGLVEFLQFFKQVVEMLLVFRYFIISMVKLLLYMFFNIMFNIKEIDFKEFSMVKEVIVKEFFKIYQEMFEIDMFFNVVIFLDFCYKRLFFFLVFEWQQVENCVVEEVKGLLDKVKDGGYWLVEDKIFLVFEEFFVKKFMWMFMFLFISVINNMLVEIFCQMGGVEDQEEWYVQVVEELSNFKFQKVFGFNEDFFKWWLDCLVFFFLLFKVFQKYWCVIVMCVVFECFFGFVVNVVSVKRNWLVFVYVDEQVFLYENVWSGVEVEFEDQDEGEWGLDQEQVFFLGDGVSGGFFGIRDSSFLQ